MAPPKKSKGKANSKSGSTPTIDQPPPYTHFPTFPGRKQDASIYLGSYFANKPHSRLTVHHGFRAQLTVPTPFFPKDPLAGKGPSENHNEKLFRFTASKMELYEYRHNGYLNNVHCLIDETTSHSFILKSLVERLKLDEDYETTEKEREKLQLQLGPVFIPGKILVGVTDICLLIDDRSHLVSTWVVDKLFPSHPEVNIQIVLGRDFLGAFPGLVMKPMYRGVDELDLIPWSIHSGTDVGINHDGELLIYVYGYSEVQVIDEKRGIKREQGSFGIFFGPNSNNNMFRRSTFQKSPLDEFAMLEGIMYAVKASLHARWVEGNYTYTSVRIYINSEEIFNVIGFKEVLKKYREANWKDEDGELIKHAGVIRVWDEWSTEQLSQIDNDWMKEEVVAFATAGREDRWMEAASILAMSGCKNSYAVKEIRRIEDVANRWENYFLTFIDLFPSRGDGSNSQELYKLICYRKKDFIKAQNEASEAASDPTTKFDPSKLKKIDISGFYPSGVIGIFVFWRSLEMYKKRTAAQMFAISKRDFIEKVVQIGRERGRLMSNVEWGDILGGDSVKESVQDPNDSPGPSVSPRSDDSGIDAQTPESL